MSKIMMNPELLALMGTAKQQYIELDQEIERGHRYLRDNRLTMSDIEFDNAITYMADLERQKANLFITTFTVGEFSYEMAQKAIEQARQIVADGLSDDATYNIGMYGEEFGQLLLKNQTGECTNEEKLRLGELHVLIGEDLFNQVGLLEEVSA